MHPFRNLYAYIRTHTYLNRNEVVLTRFHTSLFLSRSSPQGSHSELPPSLIALRRRTTGTDRGSLRCPGFSVKDAAVDVLAHVPLGARVSARGARTQFIFELPCGTPSLSPCRSGPTVSFVRDFLPSPLSSFYHLEFDRLVIHVLVYVTGDNPEWEQTARMHETRP